MTATKRYCEKSASHNLRLKSIKIDGIQRNSEKTTKTKRQKCPIAAKCK
jgi:hypothetical protein